MEEGKMKTLKWITSEINTFGWTSALRFLWNLVKEQYTLYDVTLFITVLNGLALLPKLH